MYSTPAVAVVPNLLSRSAAKDLQKALFLPTDLPCAKKRALFITSGKRKGGEKGREGSSPPRGKRGEGLCPQSKRVSLNGELGEEMKRKWKEGGRWRRPG